MVSLSSFSSSETSFSANLLKNSNNCFSSKLPFTPKYFNFKFFQNSFGLLDCNKLKKRFLPFQNSLSFLLFSLLKFLSSSKYDFLWCSSCEGSSLFFKAFWKVLRFSFTKLLNFLQSSSNYSQNLPLLLLFLFFSNEIRLNVWSEIAIHISLSFSTALVTVISSFKMFDFSLSSSNTSSSELKHSLILFFVDNLLEPHI